MSVLQLVCFSPSDMHPPNFDTPWLRHDCDHPLWPQSWNYMNSVSLRRSLRIFIGSKRAVHEWDNSIWYSIKYDDRYNHMFTNHQYFTDIWSIWGGFPKSLNYFLRVQFTLTSIWCTQNMRHIYTTIFYPTTGLRRATLLVNWVNIIGVYQRK